MSEQKWLSLALSIVFLFFGASVVYAQIPDSLAGKYSTRSAQKIQVDSLSQSGKAPPASVNFSSTDSLIFTFKKGRVAKLYGSAVVEHSKGTLNAGQVELDLTKKEMGAQAESSSDTLGLPVLLRDGQQIRTNKVRFNYETEKGVFDVARVQVDQGNLIGTRVKRESQSVVYVGDGIYSTCELDHPHYYIKAKKMKVVDDEEIFFTNAKLYILDIPYPLVFPVGYLPAKLDQKQSGLLSPEFVNQRIQTRGYGLRNLGWFQYFNDNLTGTLRGSIFTSGSFSSDVSVQYRKTGQYNGSVNLGFSREQGLEPTDPDFGQTVQRNVNITHAQTISPYANLSANINLRTSDFFARNSLEIEDRAQVTTSSSANYTYSHPENLFNLSANAQQSQNFTNNTVNLTGPNASFRFRQFQPFDDKQGKQKLHETIFITYNNNFNSRYNFQPIAGDSSNINWIDALFSPSKHRQATGQLRHINYGLRHQTGISGKLIPSDVIQVTGNVSLTEFWVPNTIRREFNPETQQVDERLVNGFGRATVFNTGVSVGTTIYGTSNVGVGNLRGLRHTITPNITYTYSPDFSSSRFGYFRDLKTPTDTTRFSIFQGSVIGGPSAGESQTISVSVNNVFETKQIKRDSTGEVNSKKIKILESMRFSTGYNFAADRFKLQDLNGSYRTNIAGKFAINGNLNFTFYATDSNGVRINKFLIDEANSLLRLTRFSVNVTTSFRGGGNFRPTAPYYPQNYDPFNQGYFGAVDQSFYMQPVIWHDVPWSLSMAFQYSWVGVNPKNIQRQATLNLSNISVRLTEKWQVSTSTGYDFMTKEITPTRFRINRNLHCWNLSMNWSPFGDFKFFSFTLQVNSNQFSNLFQKLPGLNNLRRTSGNNIRL